MDERFTYLVEKYLDHNLDASEKVEFEKYLTDPSCIDYLKEAEKVEEIIEKGFRLLNQKMEKKLTSIQGMEEFSEEVEADILLYGGMRDPETVAAVKLMHQNMLIRRTNIRRLIFSSVAAAILIGIGIFFLQPSMTSPQKLGEKYYQRFHFIHLPGLLEINSKYDKASLAYIKFEYSLSTQICRDIIASGSPDADVHFLYGLNLMVVDSMESALQQFNTAAGLISEKVEYLYVPVHWYSALCYLSMGKSNAALRELEMIRGKDYKGLNEFDVEGLIGRIRGLKRR